MLSCVKSAGSSPRGTKLYVGNLNFSTTVEELQKAFAEYGEVKDVYLPSDYDGNPRGFAFVQMEEENALKAIDGLNGLELGGRTLNVKKSLPKVTSNSR
jgi:RNA recognition motif-containing protein